MLVQIVTENGQKKVIPLTADAGAGNPVGTIIPMYKKSSPSGYLYCDGSTFDETQYPLLYAYLGSNVLPDYREFALVGAEENTTDVYNASTNPTGTIHDHDVYTEGQAKDDQLQDHEHKLYYPAISADVGLEGNTVAQGTNQGLWTWGTNNSVRAKSITVGRHGTVTRGKRKAVYFYIKATSGLSENAQDNVVAQLNEQRSYSTEEHLTGRKWIDGKPIYRKVVDFGYLPNNVSKTVAHGISGISSVIQTYGIIRNTRLDYWLPLPFSSKTSTNAVGLSIVGSNIQITTGADRTEETAIVILEYTKTT